MNTLDIIALKEVNKLKNREVIDMVDNNRDFLVIRTDFSQRKDEIVRSLSQVHGLKILTYWDSDYPQIIRNIPDPPAVLYCLGDVSLLNSDCLSIVGSRKTTEYGRQICKNLCAQLDDHTLVSGMAFGIDTIVHQNAKRTIAVLGCGVDVIYPQSNKELYRRLIEEELVISEFFPGTPPAKYTFPYRNRIIAGLSSKTIVVEASKKSGSLITAAYAANFSRDVYAVPGDITRLNSEGTNHLIYSGATPIISVDRARKILGLQEKSVLGSSVCKNEESALIGYIREGISTLDELAEKTGRDLSELMAEISEHEINGLIYQESGKYYYKG